MLQTLSYYIKTIYRWLLRSPYSRGFGIQSPSAYSFVRYVINEHYPYYAYQDLDEEMNERSRGFRKLGKLIFRLANFWQPCYVIMGDYDFAPYIEAGCKKALVRMIDDFYFDEEGNQRLLVVLDMDWLEDDSIYNELLEYATEDLLLVCIGIYENKSNRQLWKQIVADERSGVAYDLYSCGILFFDKTKYKQEFKINF